MSFLVFKSVGGSSAHWTGALTLWPEPYLCMVVPTLSTSLHERCQAQAHLRPLHGAVSVIALHTLF